jgi:sulfonate transport system substrate-binding protein
VAVVVAGTAAVVAPLAVALGPAAAAPVAPTTTTTALAPVTLVVGDQWGELQALFQASGQLGGASYTVQWAPVASGPALLAAEAAGSVDVGLSGGTALLFAQAQRLAVRAVAAQTLAGRTPAWGLVAPTGSPVTSVRSLRGRAVGVTEGSDGEAFLVAEMARAGLAPSAVRMVDEPPGSAGAALAGRSVDAAVVGQPELAAFQTGGQAKVVEEGSAPGRRVFLVASQAALSDPGRRAAVVDLVRRIVNAEAALGHQLGRATSAWASTGEFSPALAAAALGRTTASGVALSASVRAAQQTEADALWRAGILHRHLSTAAEFDPAANRAIGAARVPGLPLPTTTTSSPTTAP